jgi:hypothetical protein
MKAAALGVLALVSTAARADQCLLMTKEQADRSAAVLTPGSEFVEYCEPCRTPPPKESQTVRTVSSGHPEVRPGGPVDPGFWAVTVNGAPRDVAYLFVQRGPRWENVAMLAGCPVVDVKQTFEFFRRAAPEQHTPGSPGVHCTIRSGRAVVFDGPCKFQGESGGTFSISSVDPRGDLFQGIVLMTVAVVQPGEGDVRGLTAGGINSRWGEARRSKADPACWTGDDFEVCARRIGNVRLRQ